MMAALIEAADKAAAACDDVQTIAVGLRGTGFVVMGRIALPHLGYTHELSVPYACADLEPSTLVWAVERMALSLAERRGAIATVKIGARDAEVQPAVRVIERSDWSFWDQAVRAVAGLAIVACVPLSLGMIP